MEYTDYCEDDNRSADSKILRILWIPKVHLSCTRIRHWSLSWARSRL